MGQEKYDSILKCIESGEHLESISSLDLLNVIIEHKRNEAFFIRNHRRLISLCTKNFNIYDYISLRYLKGIKDFDEEIKELFDNTISATFSNITQLLLNRLFLMIKDEKLKPEEIFSYIMNACKDKTTEEASIILLELTVFLDFKEYLEKNYPLSALIIKSYVVYDNTIIGKNMFKGSSIIGKLVRSSNEKLLMSYLHDLYGTEKPDVKNFKMIGGGGSSLVFEINNQILKLGETRNSKKIFVNHRILESKVRDLISKNETPLFFVEIMNPAIVYDENGNLAVTEAERDELVADLKRQGIIWEDTKLENCGLLQDNDTNDTVDYTDMDKTFIAGVIDNPYDKLEFSKRKRRVVVIDNDDMRLDPKYCK